LNESVAAQRLIPRAENISSCGMMGLKRHSRLAVHLRKAIFLLARYFDLLASSRKDFQ